MAYFKLNIPQTSETIDNFKTYLKETGDDIGYVYRGMQYVQGAWNDPCSILYMEKIKKDRNDVFSYFDYLNDLYDEISLFKNNIDDICHKQGYNKESIVFKFDDSSIEECRRKLNNVIYLLNTSLYNININSFGTGFKYINTVYNLRSEITNLRNIAKELLNQINAFCSSVNKELELSNHRMKKISSYSFKLKTFDYDWKYQDVDTKIDEIKDFEKNEKVYIERIDDNIVKKSELKPNNGIVNVLTNSINIKERDEVSLGNVGNGVIAKGNMINYDSDEDKKSYISQEVYSSVFQNGSQFKNSENRQKVATESNYSSIPINGVSNDEEQIKNFNSRNIYVKDNINNSIDLSNLNKNDSTKNLLNNINVIGSISGNDINFESSNTNINDVQSIDKVGTSINIDTSNTSQIDMKQYDAVQTNDVNLERGNVNLNEVQGYSNVGVNKINFKTDSFNINDVNQINISDANIK